MKIKVGDMFVCRKMIRLILEIDKNNVVKYVLFGDIVGGRYENKLWFIEADKEWVEETLDAYKQWVKIND